MHKVTRMSLKFTNLDVYIMTIKKIKKNRRWDYNMGWDHNKLSVPHLWP